MDGGKGVENWALLGKSIEKKGYMRMGVIETLGTTSETLGRPEK